MEAVVGGCECVGGECCVRVDVYSSTVCYIRPLVTSTPADSSQSNGANEAILSQKVYGELSIFMSVVSV